MKDEPAFPVVGEYGFKLDNAPGMTLRDYFAAKAMPGALAYHMAHGRGEPLSYSNCEAAALDSYGMADAMLKAREAK